MHSKKGGAYISNGTYGCVFTPPVRCSSQEEADQFHNNNYVGKVFISSDSYTKEKAIMEIVHKLDPKQTFTIHMAHTCKIEPEEKEISTPHAASPNRRQKFSKSCSQLGKGDYQIIYPHGGNDIEQYAKVHKNDPHRVTHFLKWFVSLRPLIRGMQKMIASEYIHMDIKPKNILYNEESDSKLIDFGFLRTFDQFVDEFEDFMGSMFLYWPIEFKLLHDIKHDMITPFKDYTRYVVTQLQQRWNCKMEGEGDEQKYLETGNKRYQPGLYNFLNIVPSLEYARLHDKAKILHSELTSGNAEQVDGARAFIKKQWLAKSDIFSLGVTIFDVLYKFNMFPFKERSEYLEQFQSPNRSPNTQAKLTGLEAAISDWASFMIHPDPEQRPTIHKVILDYNRLYKYALPLIEKTV